VNFTSWLLNPVGGHAIPRLVCAVSLLACSILPWRYEKYRPWKWDFSLSSPVKLIGLSFLGALAVIASDVLTSIPLTKLVGADLITEKCVVSVLTRISPFFWMVAIALGPIVEEVVFRGTLLSFLRDKSNTAIALVLSSAVYALVRITDPGVHPLAGLMWFSAGTIFGIGYLLDGLKLSIGVHSTANFMVFLIYSGVF